MSELQAVSKWLQNFDLAGLVGALIVFLQGLQGLLSFFNRRKLNRIHDAVNGHQQLLVDAAHAAGVQEGKNANTAASR